ANAGPVSLNQSLTAGQLISTGANSSAAIRCLDGTRLILGGNTSVDLEKAGKIRVEGDLAVDVSRRPRPLRIVTPKFEVEARDAKLILRASALETLVDVPEQEGTRGAVQLKRLADSQVVSLRPGELAIASSTGDLSKRKATAALPETFVMRFGR